MLLQSMCQVTHKAARLLWGSEKGKTLEKVQVPVQDALPLGLYDSDLMVLGVANKDII